MINKHVPCGTFTPRVSNSCAWGPQSFSFFQPSLPYLLLFTCYRCVQSISSCKVGWRTSRLASLEDRSLTPLSYTICKTDVATRSASRGKLVKMLQHNEFNTTFKEQTLVGVRRGFNAHCRERKKDTIRRHLPQPTAGNDSSVLRKVSKDTCISK